MAIGNDKGHFRKKRPAFADYINGKREMVCCRLFKGWVNAAHPLFCMLVTTLVPVAGNLIHQVLLYLHYALSVRQRFFFFQLVQDLAAFHRIDQLGLFFIHFLLRCGHDFLLFIQIIGQAVQVGLKGNQIGDGGTTRQLVFEFPLNFRTQQLEPVESTAGLIERYPFRGQFGLPPILDLFPAS